MKKSIAIFCFVFLLTTIKTYAAIEEKPTEQLKPTINGIVAILQDDNLQGSQQTQARRIRIMEAISSGFDFREMSKRILGRAWKEISPAQRNNFVREMTKLLENVYIGRLEAYSDPEVTFVDERIKGRRAQVSTLVQYKENTLPIHYILHKQQSKWLVYDINIGGVSLIRNYMKQFRAIMRQQNFNGLMEIIERKNRSFS